VIRFLNFKKGQLESLQTQQREIHVGNYLKKKTGNTTIILSIHLLHISICDRKTNTYFIRIITHRIHSRFTTNSHPPTDHLTKFQKAVHYSAIKIFNNLPHNIIYLANEVIPFRNTLRRFYSYILFITAMNILIIRDIPLKIKLTLG
jgi:hypothetical protein